ncbi:MAG: hypothetical protein JW722_06790 [Demequinaceae bacterium]|nr:hypothetical protein [Demequinaceae bacterium]
MAEARGTEALVALEDAAPEALQAQILREPRPIWPYMRIPLASAVWKNEFSHYRAGPKLRRQQVVAFLRDALRHGGSRLSAMPPSRYLFYTSGITVQRTERGQKNWLVDDYALSIGDRAVVLQKAPFRFSSRTEFPQTFRFDRALAKAEVNARLRPLRGGEASLVRDVVRAILDEFTFPIDQEQAGRIEHLTLFQLARAKGIESSFARVLDRVRPEIVFVDGAAYGNMAGQIAMMKDRGIRVVEPQHGWIGLAHPAYNFGRAMKDPVLQRTFPDALLTFGDFWSSQIRFPAEVVSVGKPHIEEMTAGAPSLGERSKEILVVSSVTDPDEMTDFTLALRQALPDSWRVAFRPHPSERADVGERYSRLMGASGVFLDHRSDVFESLREVRAVVGVQSTVLFEALAFGCRTFVKESAFSEVVGHPAFGEPVSGPESIRLLVEILEDEKASELPSGEVAEIWKPGAVETFVGLLDSWRGSK